MTADIPRPLKGRRRRRLLVRLVLNGLAQAAATWGGALIIESAFDHLVRGRAATASALAAYGGALALLAVLVAALRGVERVDGERLGQSYVTALRGRLHDHLLANSARALQARSQGATMLRFVGDLTAVRQWVSLGLARLVVSGTLVGGTLVVLGVVSPVLAAVVGAVLACGAAAALGQGAAVRTASREARRLRSRLAANIDEQVGAVAVIQAFGQEARERRRVRRQSRALEHAMVVRAARLGVLRAISAGTAAIAAGAVLIVGATQVVSGHITPGMVVAAMAIVHQLAQPLRELGRVQEYWHGSRVALEKISEFLAAPSRLTTPAAAPALELGAGRLELVDVGLGDAVRGVTATAEPGEVVAIVGPNGAGKSSLLALVGRLIDLDGGVIRLDGHDLAAHSLESVRKAIGMVGPDLPLMRGSVERTLRYRHPDAGDEELAAVIARCGLEDLLDRLPDGLRSRLSEGGRNLSAGERQRLALARALLGDPRVLLLDEADANLDGGAAAIIERVLAAHAGTVLLVTHRAERVLAADQVWHLADGRLIEAGPPTELLAGSGPTARLFATDARQVA